MHILRKIFRKRPAGPRPGREIVPDEREYLRLQIREYLSHESEVERWAQGQRRFVEIASRDIPRSSRILDCACGDGVGLDALRSLGFGEPVGVELSAEKAGRARALGFRVEKADMHDLSVFGGGSFDAIISSHTLEHARDPARVLAEFRRILAPRGGLFVVLPYPDRSPRNERAHPGKYELGTHIDDGGETVAGYFLDRGFEVLWRRLDGFREPEIWLSLRVPGELPV